MYEEASDLFASTMDTEQKQYRQHAKVTVARSVRVPPPSPPWTLLAAPFSSLEGDEEAGELWASFSFDPRGSPPGRSFSFSLH